MKSKLLDLGAMDDMNIHVSNYMGSIMCNVNEELVRGITKYPSFAKNLSHAGLVLMEEAGEVARAIVQFDEGEVLDKDVIRKEIIQTICVSFRLLEYIDTYETKSMMPNQALTVDELKDLIHSLEIKGDLSKKGEVILIKLKSMLPPSPKQERTYSESVIIDYLKFSEICAKNNKQGMCFVDWYERNHK